VTQFSLSSICPGLLPTSAGQLEADENIIGTVMTSASYVLHTVISLALIFVKEIDWNSFRINLFFIAEMKDILK